MSKFKDFQQKAIHYLKRGHNEKEEIKYAIKMNEVCTAVLTEEPPKYDTANEKMRVGQAFLIDYELLKPFQIKLNKIWLCYLVLILWILSMLNENVYVKWFLLGVLSTVILMTALVSKFYLSVYSTIEYRSQLLDYYGKELERLKQVSQTDDTKYLLAKKRRKGWVYLSEKYTKNTFNVSQLVLAYAILQNGNLTLYVIDDKFILKPKTDPETFATLIKKMKSCHKIALDVNEIHFELVTQDLSYGRLWNRKSPIKIIADKELSCMIDIEAPASIFVETASSTTFGESCSIPNYHRSSPLKIASNTFFIFGINAREKERWFYAIRENSKNKFKCDLTKYVEISDRASYNTYIEDIMKKSRWIYNKLSVNIKDKSSNTTSVEANNPNLLMASSMFSLNVMFSRLFWDLWRQQSWNTVVLNRIQRSLNRLPLPPFLKFLKAEDVNLGDTLPLIFSAETPVVDEDGGLWINCPMYYDGKFSITLNTQINTDLYNVILEKNKEKEAQNISTNGEAISLEISKISPGEGRKSTVTYNQTSANLTTNLSSKDLKLSNNAVSASGWESDDESPKEGIHNRNVSLSSSSINLAQDAAPPPPSSEKAYNEFMDTKTGKIVQNAVKFLNTNKVGIKLSSSEFAKKLYQSAVSTIENSQLSLLVSLTQLKGTLTLYIPAPPTDRIWYGFRTMPIMSLSVKSKIGSHKSRKFPLITQWIERKLKEEFKDILVLPSMEDIVLSFLSSDIPVDICPDTNR